jgi:hypothetical protein
MSNGPIPKSFAQITEEMVKAFSISDSVGCGCGPDHDHFGNKDKKVRSAMFQFLRKLGLTSPPEYTGGILDIESLSAVLKMATFDDAHLKLWSDLVSKKSP